MFLRANSFTFFHEHKSYFVKACLTRTFIYVYVTQIYFFIIIRAAISVKASAIIKQFTPHDTYVAACGIRAHTIPSADTIFCAVLTLRPIHTC